MASLLRRGFASQAAAAHSNKVTIGLIPADGIGREVIPVRCSNGEGTFTILSVEKYTILVCLYPSLFTPPSLLIL